MNLIKENKENDEDMWLNIFNSYLGDKKLLIKTLKTCNISTAHFLGIEKSYQIDKSRSGLILKTINPQNKKIERTIIDIVHGEDSSYQQLLDVAFNRGKNCKNRIIMFDGVKDGINPSCNGEMIDDFITYINRFDQNICQIQVDMHFFIGLSTMKLWRKPPEKSEFSASELPGLEKFQDAEFWQFYFYPNTILHPLYESEKVGDYLFQSGYLSDEILLTWDEEGVIFKVSKNLKDITINKILDDKPPEIEKKYDGKKIIVNRSKNGPIELKIIYDDRPVNDFYHLSLNEKIKLADLISEEFYNFSSLMEEWLLETQQACNKGQDA